MNWKLMKTCEEFLKSIPLTTFPEETCHLAIDVSHGVCPAVFIGCEVQNVGVVS